MTGHSPPAWRVRVLGTLSIESASADDYQDSRLAVMLQRRQTLMLLAILAIAGPASVPRERLLELLWSDGDTMQNRNALAQLLFRTRRALGVEAVTGRQALRLNANVIVTDVAEFWHAVDGDHFADAVARYNGALLDGVPLGDTPALERWVAGERARLEEANRRAVERVNGQSARAGSLRVRAIMPHGRRLAGMLVIAASIIVFPSLISMHNDGVRRSLAIVTPFDNETGDTSFDRMCRLGAASIAAARAQSHLADTVQQSASEQARRDAVAVYANLFRIGADSLALFVRIVRPSDGQIITALSPLVVPAARSDQLVTLARQRVLAYFSAKQSSIAGFK